MTPLHGNLVFRCMSRMLSDERILELLQRLDCFRGNVSLVNKRNG